MIGRLQFKHDNKLYASKEAIKAMLDVTVKDIDGKYALFAEPIVFKYGEDENDSSTWNIVLAIGKYGDGTQHSKNEYFLIDTATLESDIADIKSELGDKDTDLDRINDAIESVISRLDADEDNIETLFSEVGRLDTEMVSESERVDTELAKKLEFPDLKLIYDPKSGPNNDGAIRLEWNGHTYTQTQSIPIRDFIKDAMVQEANVIVKEDGNPYLHIVWNEDAEKGSTDIPLNMLVDIYTIDGEDGSNEYLRIDEHNIIHINVWDGNSPYEGLATGSQVHDISDRLASEIFSANTRINDEVNTLNTRITNEVNTINSAITNQVNTINSRITTDEVALSAETATRERIDNTIIGNLDTLSGTVISNKSNVDAEIANLKSADSALTDAINEIPTYDIVKTSDLTYSFRVNGEEKTAIDIPQDMIVTSGEVKNGYIYIYLNALDEHGNQQSISFPVSDLIDDYVVENGSENYIRINNHRISLNVDVINGLASYNEAVASAQTLNTRINTVENNLSGAIQDINTSISGISRNLNNKLENTDLDLQYDNNNKFIKLVGKNGQQIATISANEFVKDGMVSNVELVDNSLVITWNTDAGDKITIIPLAEIIKTYRVAQDSTSYLSIDPETYEISIKIGNDNNRTGLASYTSVNNLVNIVGSGFTGTTITEEIEEIRNLIPSGDTDIYSPEIDGGITVPIAVGGVETGTTVSNLSGKTYTEVLNNILFPELYPSTPTKPAVAALNGGEISGNSLQGTLATVGSTLTIAAVTPSITNGKFNASYTVPAQPTPLYNRTVTTTVSSITGFDGYTSTDGSEANNVIVKLGTNSIKWKTVLSYDIPRNKPKTSYGNETIETGKTPSTRQAAIWTAGSSTKDLTKTVTGVYPIFINVINGSLGELVTAKVSLYSGTTSPEIVVPSESNSQQHFMIDYPASKTVVKLLVKDLSGNFVDFLSTYDADSESGITHQINGVSYPYKRLKTTGTFLGTGTYKLVLDSGLSV